MKINNLSSDRVWDYENGYYWFSPYNRIAKQIAHWEIYKQIQSVPGHVIELGVYKGSSIVRWATFREMLENAHSRKIVGFDAFGKFPVNDSFSPDDRNFIERFEDIGGDGLSVEELHEVLAGKGFVNIDLIEGDVHSQIPSYLNDHPELKISLLHLDMDVYEPTIFALRTLWSRLSRGGLVVIDDYNAVEGATRAVDEFFKEQNISDPIIKNNYYYVPSYVIKS